MREGRRCFQTLLGGEDSAKATMDARYKERSGAPAPLQNDLVPKQRYLEVKYI